MPTYSHSRLETYGNCPRQYKLQYIDRVEIEEFEGIEAFLGGRVHEALEKLYKDVRMTRLPAVEEVVAYFDRAWDENWHEGVNIVRAGYTPENYRELGRKAITQYYEQHCPFDDSKIIAVEHLVFFPLDEGGTYWIRGVIDRLAQAKDGTYEIHDYKTSGRLKTQGEVDKDRQLALYHLAIERMWPDVKNVDLVWHYLVFGKELRSRRTPEELKTLRDDVMGIIRTIENDREFRPHESALCDWCAYPAFCPAKKHGMMIEDLSPNKYLEEPGVRLVNKYAEFQRKKAEVEAELDQIKTALVKYAREHDVEVVRGSDHKALVRVYTGLGFPGKDDPGREELEALVRRLGLWDRVSMLSTVGLAKLVESGALDHEITERLSALGREEERPWVKLSNLRSDRD
ncbi:MAG TPA: PD-(D/E)XK nuclease family protein [bacterium]|nr:PD-(D/E)XK nuclease family protein [bacterium]